MLRTPSTHLHARDPWGPEYLMAGQAQKDQSGGRASMPATLSHRQPDLDMTSQLQENNCCNASLHSPACMRKNSQSGMGRGCHATAGMGHWQNRNGTGDAMPQQVWGRGCHATTGMGQGMPWHSRYGQGMPWHSRYGTGDAMAQQI